MGVLHLLVGSYLHAYEFLWSLKYTCIPLHLYEITLKMFCIVVYMNSVCCVICVGVEFWNGLVKPKKKLQPLIFHTNLR